MDNNERKISRGFWIKLGLAPFLMFGFAFALVPLYDTFCDISGLNGRASNKALSYKGPINSDVDLTHKISLELLSSVAPGFPLKFYPKDKKIDIVPGKIYVANYIVENHSDDTIIGQAVPSFAPGIVAKHFKKLQCFCFSKQIFKPNTTKEMEVRFFVDSKLDKGIVDITLSYNFFKINNNSDSTKESTAAL